MKEGEERTERTAESGYSADVVIGAGLRGGVHLPHWNYSLAYEGQTGQEVTALYGLHPLTRPAFTQRGKCGEWRRAWKLCSVFLFAHVYGDSSR